MVASALLKATRQGLRSYRPSLGRLPLHSRSLSTATGGHSVYSWGTGDEAQLGHSHIIKSGMTNSFVEAAPKKIETFPPGTLFTDVSTGVSHSAAVTATGELYTWGNAEYGKLGHDTVTDTSNNKKLCLLPSKVELEEKVKQVACGEFHTAVLSEAGNVYTWGWGGSTWGGVGCLGHGSATSVTTPTKVVFPDDAIKMTAISTGKYHMAAIGEGGEVWTWGRGEYGRNGNGGNADQLSPEPIEYFLDCDISLTKISCGSNYTLGLTDDGKAYGWGSNDHCQLGLGGGFAVDMFSMENFPKQIDALETETIVHVSAGLTHAIAITATGEVYMWGMKMWMEPHKMSVLSNHIIVSGSCGNSYTIVINDAGQLFSWGKGMMMRNSGVLGLGHTKRTVQPELIESLSSSSIQKVSCGSKSVMAISGLPAM